MSNVLNYIGFVVIQVLEVEKNLIHPANSNQFTSYLGKSHTTSDLVIQVLFFMKPHFTVLHK